MTTTARRKFEDPTYVDLEDVRDRIDMGHLRKQAERVAAELANGECALVGLTPGDATLYRISFIRMHNGNLWVGGPLSGCSAEWTGPGHSEYHGYTKQHWRLDSWHTAAVVTLFLIEVGKAVTSW